MRREEDAAKPVWWMGAVAIAALVCLVCGGGQAASIRANLAVGGVDLGCSSLEPDATCTFTSRLGLTVQEVAGRDVHLASISAVVTDTRGMQDIQAKPAQLSSEDIARAAGSSMVSGRGELAVPLVLTFSVQEPYMLGTLKASVHVRGVDGNANVLEADCDASYVAPVR